MSDTFISKTFAVEKIQQECDEQKSLYHHLFYKKKFFFVNFLESNDKQLNDLKQQIENYKQQLYV